MVSFYIASLGWVIYPLTKFFYIFFLGSVFLAVGLLDLMHALIVWKKTSVSPAKEKDEVGGGRYYFACSFHL
jgi:hypothetical protein